MIYTYIYLVLHKYSSELYNILNLFLKIAFATCKCAVRANVFIVCLVFIKGQLIIVRKCEYIVCLWGLIFKGSFHEFLLVHDFPVLFANFKENWKIHEIAIFSPSGGPPPPFSGSHPRGKPSSLLFGSNSNITSSEPWSLSYSCCLSFSSSMLCPWVVPRMSSSAQ